MKPATPKTEVPASTQLPKAETKAPDNRKTGCIGGLICLLGLISLFVVCQTITDFTLLCVLATVSILLFVSGILFLIFGGNNQSSKEFAAAHAEQRARTKAAIAHIVGRGIAIGLGGIVICFVVAMFKGWDMHLGPVLITFGIFFGIGIFIGIEDVNR